MLAFRAIATVQPERRLVLAGLPFTPGEKVEVVVIGTEPSPAKRRQDWKALFRQIQALPQVKSLTDADVQAEVQAVRSNG
jgi:hypothetical protein